MNELPARPDLADLPPATVAYIEALEARLQEALEASSAQTAARHAPARDEPSAPSEAPTTIQVITVSAAGLAKRTPRHLYTRRRRGGMGVFGFDPVEGDPPAFLLLAELEAGITLLTDQGRAFRLPVHEMAEMPIHGRGQPLPDTLPLRPDENLALAIPEPLPGQPNAYLVLVTTRGQVRRIGSQYLGKNLQSGTVLHNVADGGPPAAACWTNGSHELFIATEQGAGIRFAERLAPVRGCLGMRVDPHDRVVGIAAAPENSGVFLLNSEGKGTIRLFSGFSANKSPGAKGKTAMKTTDLLGVQACTEADDIFALSQQGKVIRFAASEIPPKEGVVQGVNCMTLRSDVCVAFAVSPGPHPAA